MGNVPTNIGLRGVEKNEKKLWRNFRKINALKVDFSSSVQESQV